MSLLTKVVVFGSDVAGEDSGVQIISDDLVNLDEDGEVKKEYYPGDSRYLLVIVPDEYRLVAVKTTDGAVVATGEVTREQTDRLLFAEKDEVLSLSQLPSGSVAPKWYGKAATLTVDQQDVTAATVPCIADISYSFSALQYKLTAPATLNIGTEEGDDWPIGVVVYVEERQ